jgi:hypothetical protein
MRSEPGLDLRLGIHERIEIPAAPIKEIGPAAIAGDPPTVNSLPVTDPRSVNL